MSTWRRGAVHGVKEGPLRSCLQQALQALEAGVGVKEAVAALLQQAGRGVHCVWDRGLPPCLQELYEVAVGVWSAENEGGETRALRDRLRELLLEALGK